MSFFLIRHAKPEIDTTLPASEWRLSHQGKLDALKFAKDSLPNEIDLLISSFEPKAIETAQIMASERSIQAVIAGGLQEHARENIPYFPNPEHFQRHIKDLFAQPDECVFGTESATQALSRIQEAISTLLKKYPNKTVGFVTHGTVLSLLSGLVNKTDSFKIWRKLTLPDIKKIEKEKIYGN